MFADLRLDDCTETDGAGAWGREADVYDCFYRFSLPEFAHYFAINHPLTASEWRALGLKFDTIYDPSSRVEVGVDDHAVLYQCFRAVTMGWNWGIIFLCHEAVLQIARWGSPWSDGYYMRNEPHHNFQKTKLSLESMSITSVLGKSKDEVDQRCHVLEKAFKEADIPITWAQTTAVTKLDSVGCVLDFNSGVIMNKPSRVWRFALATEAF